MAPGVVPSSDRFDTIWICTAPFWSVSKIGRRWGREEREGEGGRGGRKGEREGGQNLERRVAVDAGGESVSERDGERGGRERNLNSNPWRGRGREKVREGGWREGEEEGGVERERNVQGGLPRREEETMFRCWSGEHETSMSNKSK